MIRSPLSTERDRARLLAGLREFLASRDGGATRRRIAAAMVCQLSAHAIQTSGSVPAYLEHFK